MKTWHALLLPAYLAICILLGGASDGGYIANCILQILAIAIIVRSFLTVPIFTVPRRDRIITLILIFGLLVMALQFAPLPYAVWASSGERAAIAGIARSAGITPDLTLMTLMPHETLKSVVWLLPAIGIFVGMRDSRAFRSSYLFWALLLATIISVLMGALQIAGGRESPYYIYDITNHGSTVGFFANSNHLTTLLLISLPFLAAIAKQSSTLEGTPKSGIIALFTGVLVIVLAGVAINGSIAGYALVLPVLAASGLMFVPHTRQRRLFIALLIPLVLASIALALSSQEFGQSLYLGTDLAAGSRERMFSYTWSAIKDYFPLGSGIGSFAEIYQQYEDPAGVTLKFVNHAHSDYLEILLETGLLGGLVLGAFLLWWSWRAYKIWTARVVDPFAWAAAIATCTILIHSMFDYPLRTAAISSIFAMSLALMAGWMEGARFLPKPTAISRLWASLRA